MIRPFHLSTRPAAPQGERQSIIARQKGASTSTKYNFETPLVESEKTHKVPQAILSGNWQDRFLQYHGRMANPLAFTALGVDKDLHDWPGLCSASYSVGFDCSWKDHHTFFSFLPDVQRRHGSFHPSLSCHHIGALNLKIPHLSLNLLDLTLGSELISHYFFSAPMAWHEAASGVVVLTWAMYHHVKRRLIRVQVANLDFD
ncbi:hypothetical protein Tco_1220833 [Tanacetum coccineum]